MDNIRTFITTLQIVTSFAVSGVLARDVCDVYGGTYTYCDDGYSCCDNNTRCCYNSLSNGVVAGIVIGSVFVILFVGIAIYVCANKLKYKPQRVVRPQQVSVSTIGQTNPPYGQVPPQPPAYSQHDNAPPLYQGIPAPFYGNEPSTFPPADSSQATPPQEKPPAYSQIYPPTNPPGYSV